MHTGLFFLRDIVKRYINGNETLKYIYQKYNYYVHFFTGFVLEHFDTGVCLQTIHLNKMTNYRNKQFTIRHFHPLKYYAKKKERRKTKHLVCQAISNKGINDSSIMLF